MKAKSIVHFILKTLLLSVVMLVVIMILSMIRPLSAGESTSRDEGTIMLLLFIVTTVYALVIGLVVHNARGSRLQLIFGLIVAFFGVQTVVGQIEAFFFLTPMGEHMGAGSAPVLQMPLAFIVSQLIIWGGVAIAGIPIAVFLFDRRKRGNRKAIPFLPAWTGQQWLVRIVAVVVAYELLYFGFGYFVAWKDPAIQEFYQGTDPGSFWLQLRQVATKTPGLYGLQAFRALLWIGFTLPVIAMLRKKGWKGALIIALFVSLPMNIPHIIPNPYMPADVRAVHFTETVSSTFIFGILLFLLFASTPKKSQTEPDQNPTT
jgi:hypothetical protein